MNLVQELYSDSGSDSDSDSHSGSDSNSNIEVRNCEESSSLPPVSANLLGKYHIEPNTLKYTERGEESNRMKLGFTKGQWASFIYLEWRPTSRERTYLAQYIKEFNHWQMTQFQALFISEVGFPQPLHITLGNNMIFANDIMRETFFTLLREKLTRAQFTPFKIDVDEQSPIVVNSLKHDTKFLTLPISAEVRERYIEPLQDIIRNCIMSFSTLSEGMVNAQKLLKEASYSPHISLARERAQSHGTWDSICPSVETERRWQWVGPSLTESFYCSAIQYDKNRASLSIPFQRE